MTEAPTAVDYPDGHETEKQLEHWCDLTEREDLDAAMFSVWLHGNWRWLTRNMSTEEREAAANAVLRHDEAVKDGPEDKLDPASVRWWRSSSDTTAATEASMLHMCARCGRFDPLHWHKNVEQHCAVAEDYYAAWHRAGDPAEGWTPHPDSVRADAELAAINARAEADQAVIEAATDLVASDRRVLVNATFAAWRALQVAVGARDELLAAPSCSDRAAQTVEADEEAPTIVSESWACGCWQDHASQRFGVCKSHQTIAGGGAHCARCREGACDGCFYCQSAAASVSAPAEEA